MTEAEVVQLFPQIAFEDAVRETIVPRGFTLVREIGRGSFGIVYEMRSQDGDPLCLKVLAVPGEKKPAVLSAVESLGVPGILEREKYPKEIRHTNVVHVYESFSAIVQGVEVPCVVSELIAGETLEAKVASGRLSQKEIKAYSHGIADGIAAMHRAWIVHRDLKPDNLMIDARFHRLVVFDFTLAEKVGDEGRIYTASIPPPSSRFCAPELESGLSAHLDHRRCDVWAEGILLYSLHTGKNPKEEAGKRGVSIQSLIKESIPRRYRSVIGKCLEEEPQKRFEDGAAVAKALKWAEWYYAIRIGIPAFLTPIVATLFTAGYFYFQDVMYTYNLNDCKEAVEVTKDFHNGVDACAAAVAYKEKSEAYLYMGHALLEQGNYTAARSAYLEADAHDETKALRGGVRSFVVAQVHRKVLELERNGKNEHAIAALEILIDLDETHSSSYYSSLAHLLLAEGNYERAASFLRLVPYYKRKKEDKKETKDILDLALEEIDAIQRSANDEHFAEKQQENHQINIEDFRTVALWYKEQGKVKDALYFAEKVLKFTTDQTNPSDNALAECHFLLGDIYFAAGDYDNAFPAYYEGNKRAPIRPDVFVNIATIWMKQKNYRGAREVLRRARDLYTNDLESTKIRLQVELEKRPTARFEYDSIITDLETKIRGIDTQLSHIPKH